MTASLLPLPDDPRTDELIAGGLPLFHDRLYPRSDWLGSFEQVLREHYPQSNSASRKLTARHYAPFPLAAGHDVP